MSNSSPFKHEAADDSVGFLLWKITTLWQRKLAVVLGGFGITQTQFAILASLRWFQDNQKLATQTNLVEHTKIDKMTISKAIRKLELNGLVERTSSLSDARNTNVQFTKEGNSLIIKAIFTIETADDEFFSCLTESQLKQYKSLTSSLIKSNTL
ncbi:Transcriptional regulator, MarR family [Moritella sp. JT01]|uniref:MarR family winged helix-turn-helix transcriptional regulator n=1 Tax=Moritella sp. JT01 TaxID=756698 RepID=UPI00079AFB6D|nr:MarR family transcriptional regulator [Moritella sp. JT01]KXO13231.1 Transcriptional regulator, MarR family [Moritella sp. JT01]